MSHARNEGPGGCVPWEDHETLRLALQEIRDRTDMEYDDEMIEDVVTIVDRALSAASPRKDSDA